ncbi:argininosuccinate synthase [Candidatus Vidania fulgoroideorum]
MEKIRFELIFFVCKTKYLPLNSPFKMNKILKNLKKIKNIALAYSGGLDTSITLKWLSKYCNVFCYYINLGQYNENIINIKKNAIKLGAKKIKIIEARKQIILKAFKIINSEAFYIRTASEYYYNITPIGRIIISKYLIKEMKKDNLNILSDGSTYKGNDIERFIKYSIFLNKKIKFYKPWLDKKFIKKYKGRKKMLNQIKTIINYSKNNYSIDSNIIGNTYEGGKIENLNFNICKLKFLRCGFIKKKQKKETNINFEYKKGIPVKFNKKKIKNIVSFFEVINKIASKHKLGISDQIEDRIIGFKSRGIYESPAMYIFHVIYERLLTCIYDIHIINTHRINGKKLGKLLYFGDWYNKESKIRKSLTKRLNKNINGFISIKIIYNKIYFKNTYSKNSIYNKKMVTMEYSKYGISYMDRIGELNIIINNILNKN